MDSLQDQLEPGVRQNVSWKLQKVTSDGALVQSQMALLFNLCTTEEIIQTHVQAGY